MEALDFSGEIKVGDFLTTGSVLIATLALFFAWLKDRRLRKREYADRIRLSASQTLVSVERWKELALRFFRDAQPLLTDADMLLVKGGNIIETRDSLWRALVTLESDISHRIVDEKLEGAYVGLYGFNPKVYEVYSKAINEMRAKFESAFGDLLDATQEDVLSMEQAQERFESAILGNRLRATTWRIMKEFSNGADTAIAPLKDQMLSLVSSRDDDIVSKRALHTKLMLA